MLFLQSTYHFFRFTAIFIIVFHFCITAESQDYIDCSSDLEPIRVQYKFPALSAAVIVNGELHTAGVVGVRKYGTDVETVIDDPFHMGSCTKAMTSSLVCLLIQQGELNWDTTLAEYFPDLIDS